MKKLVLTTGVLFLLNNLFSQQIITLTTDTVIHNTLIINNNTIIDANGHTINFLATPKVIVKNSFTLLIKNGSIVNFNRWGTAIQGCLEWRLFGSNGNMSIYGNSYRGCNPNFWLDGVPK